jgi:hypothetical protein
MKIHSNAKTSAKCRTLDGRLAAYLTAAGAVSAAMASEAKAVVIGNNNVQSWGTNGFVNIDFNQDGQVDYQIDHDHVDLGGGNFVNYLQLDKNDVNGAPLSGENPFPINVFATFPLNGTPANNTFTSAYVTPTSTQGDYPAALTVGTPIGPGSNFDFQETDNFNTGHTIRANRLIDQDHTQVDTILGGLTASQVAVPTNGPNFLGLNPTDIRYLGVKMDLNSVGTTTYGWIGIRITDQGQALGDVVGYGYETSGGPIAAGDVPEPASILTALLGGFLMAGCFLWRRLFRR